MTDFAFPQSDPARAALHRRTEVLAACYVRTRVLESARILRTSDFRNAYRQGTRIAGQYFTAFCLRTPRQDGQGPQLGFTIPRAFGKAVHRNRVKRRLREIFRLRLREFAPEWNIVINPRRAALTASPDQLRREVDRLITRCGQQ